MAAAAPARTSPPLTAPLRWEPPRLSGRGPCGGWATGASGPGLGKNAVYFLGLRSQDGHPGWRVRRLVPEQTEQEVQRALGDGERGERELGAGGMGTVFLAEDLRHGRKVAVKVLRPEIAASMGTERF